MRQAVLKVLQHLNLPLTLSDTLRIEFASTIPVAKGMASSTADIAATAVATVTHLGASLSESELAQICVAIEPTDSTLFRAPTLFDHRTGVTQTPIHPELPLFDILLLESPQQIRTEDVHRRSQSQAPQDMQEGLDNAFALLSQGIRTGDRGKIGEAALLSAIASQQRLPKPAFHALLALVEQHGLYGLNVAHSGSVVGLLMDRRRHDIEALNAQLAQPEFSRFYPWRHWVQTTQGGIHTE